MENPLAITRDEGLKIKQLAEKKSPLAGGKRVWNFPHYVSN